jgi:hypothetical protein
MDNEVPKALHYFDDSWHRYLAEATSTFDFTVAKTGHDSEQYLNEENFVSFQHEGRQYLFSIMRTEEDENQIKVLTENLNLELLNETKSPIDVVTAHDLLWYLNNDSILEYAGLTVGVNEVSNLTRKIKLESEQTALARLLSFAHQFDAEVEFEISLNSDGALKNLVVNFYKKYDGENQGVGSNRQDVTLYYGKNIDNITRTVDKTGIFNMITPTGKDGLKITNIDKEWLSDSGQLEFYTKKGNDSIYAPLSVEKYPSQLMISDGWIRRYYTADGTTNIDTLCSLALNELKKNAYPAVTYEVSGFFDLNVGDTVKIQDEAFKPMLMLKARVSEQVISFTNPAQNKTIFGNFKALESQLSSSITDRLATLVEEATPFRFEIVSSDGLTFKNSVGQTTLTGRVYKGATITEYAVDSFVWTVAGRTFGGNGASQVVTADDIDATAVVRYRAIVNGMTIGGAEVTVQDIMDGVAGVKGDSGRGIVSTTQKWLVQSSSTKPAYPWTDAKWQTSLPAMTATNKYLWQIERMTYTDNTTSDIITLSAVYGDTGTSGSDGIAGKDGVGLNSTAITYQLGSSGTATPTGTWTSAVPPLTKGKYLWTRTIWTYTDNTSETGYTVSYVGTDGNSGRDGIAGKDGVGIKSTAITYVGSTSGTTKPTSGWATTIPSVAAGSYLWTKTVWTYTDDTSETGYSVAKMGAKGAKGDKGDTGAKGTDGSAGANGTDAWAVVMTNENVTLPANAQGGVTSYANSGTSISVIYGTGTAFMPVASSATLTNNQFKVTTSASGITVGAQTVDTTNKKVNFAVASGMTATSSAVASITYTISIRNSAGVTSTVTKIQNFTKAEKGITGDDGVDSFTYFRYSATQDGASMTSLPNADSNYIGVYTGTSVTAPTSPSSYTWTKYVNTSDIRYSDNLIFNPNFEGIPKNVNLTVANSNINGWHYTGTLQVLPPESDAPSENILSVINASNGWSKAIPAVNGGKYLFSAEVKTSDYTAQANSAHLDIRTYPTSHNANAFNNTGQLLNVYPKVNGTVSGTMLDKTGVPVFASNEWTKVSFTIKATADGFIRVLPYNQTANQSMKFRRLSLVKVQDEALIKQATEPTNRRLGMLWQYTGTQALTASGTTVQPNTTYSWTGSTWQLYVVRSTNLQVDNGFITNAMIKDATIASAKIASLDATKITTGTLAAARIATNSITADKIKATTLASIVADLGEITAGSYESWQTTDYDVATYKNGIFFKDGHLKTVAIENPDNAKPYVRGIDIFAGMITMYQGSMSKANANNSTKIFNKDGSNLFFENSAMNAGAISCYNYTDGTKQFSYSANDHQFMGEVTATDFVTKNTWLDMSNGAQKKVAFGRTTIQIVVTGNGASYIQFGALPAKERPSKDLWFMLSTTESSITNARNVQVRASDGAVILWGPVNGKVYSGEISFLI